MIRADQLKGLLLVLVVAGHLLPGTYTESPLRWAIYAFHMPLFLALSGALHQRARLAARGPGALLLGLWRRPLRAWTVALAWFTAVELAGRAARGLPVDGAQLLALLRDPWYHLWFVPDLAACVALAWAAARLRLPRPLVAGLGLALSAAAMLALALLPRVPGFLVGDHLLQLGGWFFVGHALAGLRPTAARDALALLALAAGAAIRAADFALALPPALPVAGLLALNLGLAALVLPRLPGPAWALPPWVARLGRRSLPAYLWHALPLQLLWLTGLQHHRPWLAAALGAALVLPLLAALLRAPGPRAKAAPADLAAATG